MKHYYFFISSLLLFCFPLQTTAKKIALIVAVSDYEFCNDLHTEKDVFLIKQTLINQGFENKYITCLQNQEVTKANFIKTFRTKLIEIAEPGDIIVFHFSGHGQQVIDIDGDEADGYDESLVCYPAWPSWDETEYKGEEHLLDDELNTLLNELRIKAGKKGSVLLLIDACFSGTMSRSHETIRGNFNAIAPLKYNPKLKPGNDNSSGFDTSIEKEELAPIIIFSASKQDEFNSETKTETGEEVGSLSYAFSKCLNSKSKINTYRGLFDYMKIYMANLVPHQTPLAEGDIDRDLFGKKEASIKEYYKVKQIKNREIIIDIGRMGNIHKGTILGLYPIDTKKPNRLKLLSKAEVIKSNDFDAVIKIDKQLNEDVIKKSWIYIEEQSYGDMKVNIFINSNNKSWDKVSNNLIEHPLIEIMSKDEILKSDIIIKDSISKSGKLLVHYLIKNDNNSYIDTIDDIYIETISEAIIKQVIFYSKARYLKQLELNNPELDIELQLLPVKNYENRDGKYIATEFGKQNDNFKDGQIVFKEGDLFVLKLTNKGNEEAYFQIMFLTPDNSVYIEIPEEGTNEGDIKIEVGQTIIFDSKIMQISEPFGIDMFKVIASPEPLYNLRNIVKNIKDTRSMQKSPFEILTQNICSGTRELKTTTIPSNTVNINSLIIKTVKK